MKVEELIKYLKQMPQDLEVYGYCDHGQTPEKVCHPSVQYTDELCHSLYDGYSSEDDPEEGHTKEFVLL